MNNAWLHKSRHFDEPVVIADEGRNIDIEIHRQYRGKLVMGILDMLLDKNLIRKTNNALDIGSNTGSFTQIIAHYFSHPVMGIDPEDPFIQKARANYPHINFITSTIEDFKPGQLFDFIMCLEVIEHCDNKKAVVEKIHSLLNENGIALISMPNKLNPIYAFANFLDKSGIIKVRDDVRFHFHYTPKDIENLFTATGFKILYRAGFNIFIHRSLAKIRLFNEINWWLSKLPILTNLTQYYNIVVKKI